jgi:hypothetical protein
MHTVIEEHMSASERAELNKEGLNNQVA